MNIKIMIRMVLAGTLSAAVLAVSLVAAETKPRRAANQAFMRMKLAWSQAALEGLTLEKFDLISKNALRMRDMTQSNQWFKTRQPDYMQSTTNFQKSTEALFKAAADKDLTAATEAYVNVTRSCIDCHRLVRVEQRKGAAQPAKERSDLNFKPVVGP